MTHSDRNICPAGASGSAGVGAPPDFPLLFSMNYHHDLANPYAPPLAIARTGGQGGQVWVYAEDQTGDGDSQDHTSFAGGGRRWF